MAENSFEKWVDDMPIWFMQGMKIISRHLIDTREETKNKAAKMNQMLQG